MKDRLSWSVFSLAVLLLGPGPQASSAEVSRAIRLVESPALSPDGSRIAFVSTRTGSPQIFVMQSDGTLPKQISFHSAGSELLI